MLLNKAKALQPFLTSNDKNDQKIKNIIDEIAVSFNSSFNQQFLIAIELIQNRKFFEANKKYEN